MKDADREREAAGTDNVGIGNEAEAASVGSSIRDFSKPPPYLPSLTTSGVNGTA
jgi:hypothetical protein